MIGKKRRVDGMQFIKDHRETIPFGMDAPKGSESPEVRRCLAMRRHVKLSVTVRLSTERRQAVNGISTDRAAPASETE